MNFQFTVPRFVCVAALVIAFLAPSIAEARAVEEEAAKVRKKTVTEKAYAKAEKRLMSLSPGTSLDHRKIGWKFEKLRKGETQISIAHANGWISSMSGAFDGAVFGIGKVIAVDGDHIYGQHVFGSVWGNMNIAPRILLVVKARLISADEYETLKREKNESRGVAHFDEGVTLYFRDVAIHDVREVAGAPASLKGSSKERIGASEIGDWINSMYTQDSYQLAATALTELTSDSDQWDLIAALDGTFLTNDFGGSYVLCMPGYANAEKDRRWTVLRDDAVYTVWPFGYSNGEAELVQQCAVFRNGKFHKLLPYAPKEEMASQLAD